jgi:hypothetical protein
LSYARNIRDEPLATAELRFGAEKIVLRSLEQSELRTANVGTELLEKLRLAPRL